MSSATLGQIVSSANDFSGNNQGTASFVNYGSSFSSYYSTEDRLKTYWPILSNPDACFARQDILIQVTPAGCQPAVVRSDLLAEQNVPVFCQLDLLQINPIIDVKQIRNIRFSGKYPEYVTGVGFHPARAALRTNNELLGSPLTSNVGYVVVLLKRNPTEKDLPGFFNFTLSASIEYYSGNAIGIGATEFLLQEVSDKDWPLESKKQSFFKGQYSLRLQDAENDKASVSLYKGDARVTEVPLSHNQASRPVYLPGSYCQTELNFNYVDISAPDTIARIQVDEDVIDTYVGSAILGKQCTVRKILSNGPDSSVELTCPRKTVKLVNRARTLGDNTSVLVTKGKDKFKGKITEVIQEKGKIKSYKIIYTDKNNKDITETFIPENVAPEDTSILVDKVYDSPTEDLLQKTFAYYNSVFVDYRNEKNPDVKTRTKTYGEEALEKAIKLAGDKSKPLLKSKLMQEYLSAYPTGENSESYSNEMNGLIYSVDSTLGSEGIELADGSHFIRLIEVREPTKRSSALVRYGTEEQNVYEGVTANFIRGNVTILSIKDPAKVSVSATCKNSATPTGANPSRLTGYSGTLNLGETKPACDSGITLKFIEVAKVVKLTITPVTRTSTTTNFTVGVGIEKRAFQLTPSKSEERIVQLNKTIKTWETISNKLGGVVSGLKGACFATAGVLTVKNFFTGLSGEAIARKDAMSGENGWTQWCNGQIGAGKKYSTLTECYNENSDKIRKDVDARTSSIKQTNELAKSIESKYAYSDSGSPLGGGGSFDDEKAKEDLRQHIISECKDVPISSGENSLKFGNKKTVGDLYGSSDFSSRSATYQQLRDVYFNCKLVQSNSGSAEVGSKQAQTDLGVVNNLVNQQAQYDADAKAVKEANKAGKFPGSGAILLQEKGSQQVAYNGGALVNPKDYGLDDAKYKNKPVQTVRVGSDYYLAVLTRSAGGSGNTFVADEVYKLKEESGKYVIDGTSKDIAKVELNKKVNSFELRDPSAYNNRFAAGELQVKYFETEPYKGLPAVVPFDLQRGFYAATTQTLPLLGQTKSFESNGRPSSFWVCNVMQDGRVGFFTPNFGGDECVQYNFYTGQQFSDFPGLSESDTKQLVGKAIRAIDEASKKYSTAKGKVTILGNQLTVGNPASLTPATQCQDHMSPEDCKILFNVCDPVICPSTRCDFGGSYKVDNVIQSGIVGSALLCLPNYKEGILLPVCLTGIKAGIDGYLSILKSYRQCLQESVDTGQYVGICDQITAVYLCEFFWRQAAPLAQAIIPKVVEYAYTGGKGQTRGGGEYLTVQSSWKNAEESANYFTQSYAVNSIEAFNIRSVAEAGTPFCQAFVSARGPNAFKSLIQSDSPPQFHAWFSTIPFTDATVPATSQYKVFYHIFAGNDRGVSFSVYLKDPPISAAYQSTPYIVITTGFISTGQYKTETRDFTAPAGYKQLCVRINDKEECGFKQVSSSFAVNYAKDSIVKDELLRTDITTEKECISGSASPAAFLTPNLQEAAQEAIDPAVYNRGIVRVCATSNPGSGTDPSRYLQVGRCGSPALSCWLDKKSIERAIGASNVGLRNQTLSTFTSEQQAQLKSQSAVSDEAFAVEYDKLKADADKLTKSEELPNFVSKLLALLDTTFWNHQKAKLALLKADAYGIVVSKLKDTRVSTTTNSNEFVGPPAPDLSSSEQKILKLERAFNLKDTQDNYFIYGGDRLKIYVEGTKIKLDDSVLFFDTQIGTIGVGYGGKILLLTSQEEKTKTFLNLNFYALMRDKSIEDISPGCITGVECFNKYGGNIDDYICPDGLCHSKSIILPVKNEFNINNLNKQSVINSELDSKGVKPTILLTDENSDKIKPFYEFIGNDPNRNARPVHTIAYTGVIGTRPQDNGNLLIETLIYAPDKNLELFNKLTSLRYIIFFYKNLDNGPQVIKGYFEKSGITLSSQLDSENFNPSKQYKLADLQITKEELKSAGLIEGQEYGMYIVIFDQTGEYSDSQHVNFFLNKDTKQSELFKPKF